jgi:hypothetical protein
MMLTTFLVQMLTVSINVAQITCLDGESFLTQKPGVIPMQERGAETRAIRLTAAGYMLDFRYRITDPEKAQPLFDKSVKPYLIDQATGARFMVPSPPKTGSLRGRPGGKPKPGQEFFIIFANPNRYIKAGNKVTVVIGDTQAADLVVQ